MSWILIILLSRGGVSAAAASVQGFKSENACKIAGKAVESEAATIGTARWVCVSDAAEPRRCVLVEGKSYCREGEVSP